jgi:uncharacterized protein YlxW (UPF0749 family)
VSAIRGAGPAIFVDLAPLIAPYRIEVIGDVRGMQTAFARTSAAGHLSTLTGTYGITATMKAQQSLTLPGSGSSTLRYAQVLDDDVASSAQDDEEGSS